MELDEVVTIFEKNKSRRKETHCWFGYANTWSPTFDLRENKKNLMSEPNVKTFGGVEKN
jgi:hypothetical protein